MPKRISSLFSLLPEATQYEITRAVEKNYPVSSPYAVMAKYDQYAATIEDQNKLLKDTILLKNEVIETQKEHINLLKTKVAALELKIKGEE